MYKRHYVSFKIRIMKFNFSLFLNCSNRFLNFDVFEEHLISESQVESLGDLLSSWSPISGAYIAQLYNQNLPTQSPDEDLNTQNPIDNAHSS